MGSVLTQLGNAGPLVGVVALLYLCLIAFLSGVATLSRKAYRRTSALKVLRLLWLRRDRDQQ